MATYDVYVFCNECPEVHRMGIRVSLDDGPPKKESIDDLYAGKELPPSVAMIISNQVQCPNTGKMFVQKDLHQVFLVPVSE